MSRYKSKSQKKHLAKKGRQTRWAPFWVVAKKEGEGRRVHPGRFTVIKRHWRD